MVSTIPIAKRLRRNQTDAERVLWFRLRDRRLGGWKFRRQMPLGIYVVDFCCESRRLIVELDGGQHIKRAIDDQRRTRALEAMGYLVLRFWNNDVLHNTDGVVESILATLETPSAPHPHPLPKGEREPA
jgi:lysyl-tRNA synthetase class 2